MITLDLVSQTKAQQSWLIKTIVIHLVAVGCWYIIVFCPQVGCCNYIVHVEITVIILEHNNRKKEQTVMYKQFRYYKHWHIRDILAFSLVFLYIHALDAHLWRHLLCIKLNLVMFMLKTRKKDHLQMGKEK